MKLSFTVDLGAINVNIGLLQRAAAIASGGVFGMMPAIARLIEQQHRNRVLGGGPGPDGERWSRPMRGNSPLNLSGALGNGFKASSTLFTVRMPLPNLPYARIQQTGGTMRGKPKMVYEMNGYTYFRDEVELEAKPYFGISAKDWGQISRLAEQFMNRGFGWL